MQANSSVEWFNIDHSSEYLLQFYNFRKIIFQGDNRSAV